MVLSGCSDTDFYLPYVLWTSLTYQKDKIPRMVMETFEMTFRTIDKKISIPKKTQALNSFSGTCSGHLYQAFFLNLSLSLIRNWRFMKLKFALTFASFIKWSVNFRDLNFHYFGPNSQYSSGILGPYEWGVFYQGGDQWNCEEPSKWPDILAWPPNYL